MKKTSLNEVFVGKGRIIESDSSKLPSGVLCRVRYPICLIDQKNRNERIYRKQVWENVLKNADVKEKLERRILFGNQEHPIESALKLNKDDTSHIVSNILLDEKNNMVYADFDVLPTDAGRFINVLLEAGCDVGTSTRAEGELEEKIEEKSGDKYFEVVPESYQFITVDFTADPSTIGAYPMDVQRNVVNHVRSEFESKGINKEVACALLEGIKSKEAVALMESIKRVKEEKDVKVKEEPKPAEKTEKLGTDPKDSPEGKPHDGVTPNAKTADKELKVDDKGDQKKEIAVGDPEVKPEILDTEKTLGTSKPVEIPKRSAEKLEGSEEPEHVAKEIAKKMKENKLSESFYEIMADANEMSEFIYGVADALKNFKLFTYEHPISQGSSTYGIIVSDKKLSKKELEQIYRDRAGLMKDEGIDVEVDDKPISERKKPVSKKLVFENWDEMVDFMRAEFKKIKPEEQKKARKTLSECMAVSDIQTKIKGLKNALAVSEAKVDKLIEMYDSLKACYATDAIDHTKLVETLKAEKISFADKAVAECKKLLTEKAQKELLALKESLEAKLEEQKKAYESQLTELKEASAKTLSEATAGKDEEIKLLSENHTKDLVKKYFETKVAVTGLNEHLPKNASTLVEHCVSEGDVDQVIDKIRESVRMGTLTPTISEVKAETVASPATRQLNTRVGKILEKLNP